MYGFLISVPFRDDPQGGPFLAAKVGYFLAAITMHATAGQ
jgi:hypothetical protein